MGRGAFLEAVYANERDNTGVEGDENGGFPSYHYYRYVHYCLIYVYQKPENIEH